MQPRPVAAAPVAAATSVAPVLLHPRRPATVVAVTEQAVYLRTDEPACPAVCLTTAGAVRVPCALVLGRDTPGRRAPWAAGPPGPRIGDTGSIGGGELTLGGTTYRPSRWWRPARPRVTGPIPVPHPPPLDPGTSAAVARFARVLATGAPLAGPVTGLLGRGPGLTPVGDDVLAGALVALMATRAPAGPALAAEIMRVAFRRTVFVSAVLLWHAARGECVPELAALLTGAPGAAEALLRVGHTSGVGLAHGVRASGTTLREVST